MNPLILKLQKGIQELNEACYERTEEINGLVIGLLTGVNVLLLGTPGVGKSYLINLFSEMFGQGECFSWLLSKTSTPEELFGPISMKGLKEDKYEHNTEGKLPDNKIAFLDEIFKANSSILNSLLTLANERVFYNGTQRIKTGLDLIIGASNEYPKDSSLDALYDRFALKFWVEPIKQKQNIINLIKAKRNRTLPKPDIKFTSDEIQELKAMVRTIAFTDHNSEVLVNIKEILENNGYNISDRTISQYCADIVCAHALIYDRQSIKGMDWQALSNVLWTKHDQKDMVSELIGEVSDPIGQKLQAIKDSILDSVANLPSHQSVKKGIMSATDFITQNIVPLSMNLQKSRMDIEDMIMQKSVNPNDSTVKELIELITDCETKCSDLSRKVIRS